MKLVFTVLIYIVKFSTTITQYPKNLFSCSIDDAESDIITWFNLVTYVWFLLFMVRD